MGHFIVMLGLLDILWLILVCQACSGDSKRTSGKELVGDADIVLVGGRVWTGTPGQPLREALAVRGNKIVAVGDNEKVASLIGPQTTVFDVAGRSIIPGFHDAHVHLYYGSLSSMGLDLLSAPTLALTLARVADYGKAHPELTWILGHGWYFDIMPGGRLPTKEDLDSVLPLRPVVLIHMSGHYAWVNTEALLKAGIDRSTPDPPGGEIGRDVVTGEPNGLLYEAAVGPALASIDPETRLEVLRQRIQELATMGVTSVEEILVMPGMSETDLSAYVRLLEQGELGCRIHVFLSGDFPIEEVLSWKDRLAGMMLRVAGVKVFVDGNFQARTAWLLEPYAGEPSYKGTINYSQTALDTITKDAQCAGLLVKFHAIGDGAVRSALDSIEGASRSCPPPAGSHSIEHVELLHPQDVFRFVSLGTAASVQPLTALFSTTAGLSALRQEIGDRRCEYLFMIRSLKDAGATVVFGTDWPAGPFLLPLVGIWSSMVRPGTTPPDIGLLPMPQALSLEEALHAYTSLPARVLGIEDLLGTLDVGKLADITILSRDISLCRPEDLLGKVQIDLTMVDGRIVFHRAGAWPELTWTR